LVSEAASGPALTVQQENPPLATSGVVQWKRRLSGGASGWHTGCSYTVGYFGRIIQAKNLSKGGSFEGNDEGFLRFKLGEGVVIPAFEEALYGMKVGGIRRILVPPGPLSVRTLPWRS
jgi:FKBP-type peptidyl-prolyl cis-trans isomerase